MADSRPSSGAGGGSGNGRTRGRGPAAPRRQRPVSVSPRLLVAIRRLVVFCVAVAMLPTVLLLMGASVSRSRVQVNILNNVACEAFPQAKFLRKSSQEEKSPRQRVH